jgi:DNA-binding transcriptional LysR family regulator
MKLPQKRVVMLKWIMRSETTGVPTSAPVCVDLPGTGTAQARRQVLTEAGRKNALDGQEPAMAKKNPQRGQSPDPADPRFQGLSECLTIDQMIVFQMAFEHLANGFAACERKTGITAKRIHTAVQNIEEALGLREGTVENDSASANPELTKSGRFHAKLGELLEQLLRLKAELERPPQQVSIAGQEFTLMWLLPRALEASGVLRTHPAMTLDLHRCRPDEGSHMLQQGKVHLVLGPSPRAVPSRHQSQQVAEVRCGLIFHEAHRQAVGKDKNDVRIYDLKDYPIFVVRPEIAPAFDLQRRLSEDRRLAGARLMMVDSNAYIYHYVARQLGVGLFFETKHNPYPETPDIHVTDVIVDAPERAFPAATFHLFWEATRERSPEVEAVRQAIIDFGRP